MDGDEVHGAVCPVLDQVHQCLQRFVHDRQVAGRGLELSFIGHEVDRFLVDRHSGDGLQLHAESTNQCATAPAGTRADRQGDPPFSMEIPVPPSSAIITSWAMVGVPGVDHIPLTDGQQSNPQQFGVDADTEASVPVIATPDRQCTAGVVERSVRASGS